MDYQAFFADALASCATSAATGYSQISNDTPAGFHVLNGIPRKGRAMW
jgi:hypothetical protein